MCVGLFWFGLSLDDKMKYVVKYILVMYIEGYFEVVFTWLRRGGCRVRLIILDFLFFYALIRC